MQQKEITTQLFLLNKFCFILQISIYEINMQSFIHYFLHLIFPIFIALIFYKKNWKFTYVILVLTMLVDLDHLWATPIFELCRCSINFHPLHTYIAMVFYCMMLIFTKTRVIGIGLLFHIVTDAIDCSMNLNNCM